MGQGQRRGAKDGKGARRVSVKQRGGARENAGEFLRQFAPIPPWQGSDFGL